ncbi:PAS domain-containing sensor histidine kinase [Hymenobacter glacieicola]|uniref:histidine kinase n=1 Tax=Hymenobacter glacieicola TaxID=1562124 RepID=A0ABQ1X8L2_9BACT|nr:PAS domain-containing sensor histidine kinase [Hymenobacter glacieicola]GGG59406.1 hypothetical protein GCM10011378_39230 [Hymenobacter glacieicola]
MTAAAAAPPADVLDPTGFSSLLLNLSVSGVLLMRPRYEAHGEIVDFDGVRLNPAAQQMLRLPECPAESFLTLYPTAPAVGVFDFYREAFRSGTVARRQNLYQLDGLDGYYLLVAQRYQDLLVVSFTDTNDQPRSAVEEALRQSQAREQAALAEAEHQRQQLYQVLMQLPMPLMLLQGPTHVVELVNAQCQRLFPQRQIAGRPMREGLPELAGQGFFEVLDHVYQTGEPVQLPEAESWADFGDTGQVQRRYYNSWFLPFRDGQGQIMGVLNPGFDVTEQVLARQQVEQLNQELEARVQARTRALQTLFAQAPMALVVLRGPQFLIEQANAQAEHIWGVAVADVLGRPHFEAIPGSAGQGFEEMLTGILATGEAVVLREVLIKLARAHTGQPSDGYYNVIFKPLFDEGQPQPSGIVVMWTETTDQVLARQQVQKLNEELTVTNEELHASNRQLTRTNVDLDNFIYTASHDLKAPITNIEGLLLALEHELPAAARTGDVPLMLTLMQDAVDRFRRTITHLTDLSRLQKEHNPASDVVALAPVVEAVRLDLTPLLAQTQGALRVDVPEGLTVTFAEKNLRSVVYNLLSNALKYRHPDRVPDVQLRSWLTDDYAVLEVQDNGLGLDLARGQEKLFAMFQRLHTHVEGTGVGLYMVKRMVENAGGRIEVTSELGQGSTFRVYFPR